MSENESKEVVNSEKELRKELADLRKENEAQKQKISGLENLVKRYASEKVALSQKLLNVISANKAISDAAEFTSAAYSETAMSDAKAIINSLQK